ncbi:MAG: polysaccharide deacetylase family protein [Bradymonadia bacterium]
MSLSRSTDNHVERDIAKTALWVVLTFASIGASPAVHAESSTHAHLIEATDDQIERCIQGRQPPLAGCIAEAIRRGANHLVRDVRQILRELGDPAVVEAAAVALVNWRDKYSHSLLIQSLWSGRGGARGVAALAWASKSLRRLHRHSHNMRRFALHIHTDPMFRAAIKAALVKKEWLSLTADERFNLRLQILEFGYLTSPTVYQTRAAQVALKALQRHYGRRCTRLWRSLGIDDTVVAKRVSTLVGVLSKKCVNASRLSMPTRISNQLVRARRNQTNRHYLNLPDHDCRRGSQGSCIAHFDPFWVHFRRGFTPAQTGYKYQPLKQGKLPHTAFKFAPNLKQPDWFPPSVEVTIDDGIYTSSARRFLNLLDAYGVKGTFFWCGGSAAMSALNDLEGVKRIVRRVIDGGHEIAYHTMSHGTRLKSHLINWESDQVVDDINTFKWMMEWLAGHPVNIRYGRLPGGDGTGIADLQLSFAKAGLGPPVLWHQHTLQHWTRSKRQRNALARHLRKRCRSYILLLHEYGESLDYLETFLGGLYATRHAPTCQNVVNHFPLQDMLRSEWGFSLKHRVRKVMRRRKREGRSEQKGTRSTVESMLPFQRQLGFHRVHNVER